MNAHAILASMLCVLGAAACTGDGAGDGDDVLPKRGELSTDPTIVSAVAHCTTDLNNGSIVSLRIDGSDPGGGTNLSTCAGSMGDLADQDSYNGGVCYVGFATTCTKGEAKIVDITVANKTGGVTTASIKLLLQ